MVLGQHLGALKKETTIPGLDPSQLLKGALKYRKRFQEV